MKLPSKAWLITIGILLLFILTNPSVSAFKTFRGRNSYQGLYRPVNFFICSIYKDRSRQFFGILGNFIGVGGESVPTQMVMGADSTTKTTIDSTKSPNNFYEIPYKDRVYIALKDNLKNFNTTEQDFDKKIKDKNYAMKVYSALRDNIRGFNKKPDDFIKAIND